MQRENAVDDFRAGKTWVLIATDVIARGMDFKGVNCVINYDFPDSAAAYIHRIGMLLLLYLLRTIDRCHSSMVVWKVAIFFFVQIAWCAPFRSTSCIWFHCFHTFCFALLHCYILYMAELVEFLEDMWLVLRQHTGAVTYFTYIFSLVGVWNRSIGQGRKEWRSRYLLHWRWHSVFAEHRECNDCFRLWGTFLDNGLAQKEVEEAQAEKRIDFD